MSNLDLIADRAGTADFIDKRADLRMSLDGQFIIIVGPLGYYQVYQLRDDMVYTSLVAAERSTAEDHRDPK